MLITLFRSIILYILVIIALRLMGKQQISQLQPFEFVLTLMIAELASIPMEDTGIPLLKGIIPIITLLFAQVSISFLSLKSQSFRKFVSGTPVILIKNGVILEDVLKKNRYNINDLLEQLRIKNFPNVRDIAFVFLETNGEISVIPKAEQKAVVMQDLHLPAQETQMPLTLILDGIIQHDNLRLSQNDYNWLYGQLNNYGIKNPSDTLIAMLDTKGSFYAQAKQKISA